MREKNHFLFRFAVILLNMPSAVAYLTAHLCILILMPAAVVKLTQGEKKAFKAQSKFLIKLISCLKWLLAKTSKYYILVLATNAKVQSSFLKRNIIKYVNVV